MITIFGATGVTGAPLVDTLLRAGAAVRAVTSNPDKIETLRAKGCEAMAADFADRASLERACDGAERIYLVTPAHQDMRAWKANAIKAAKTAGVRHIVMATGLGASPKARLTFGMWHSESQEMLKDSGMDWTFVQPTYFMQNVLWQADTIASKGVYFDDLGGAAAWIDARDIADVAAVSLTEQGHEGRAYALTGPEALAGDDIAGLLTEATGRAIRCVPLLPSEAKAGMTARGMHPDVADAMTQLASIAPKGYLAGTEDTVERILGRPARRFRDFLRESAASFAAA